MRFVARSLVPATSWVVAASLVVPRAAFAREADACVAAAEGAQTLRANGHLRDAREKLLVCSRDVCPAVVQTDCKHWLADVEAATPTVVLRVVDEHGGDVVAVRVSIDGQVVAERLDGRPLVVDPGDRVVRVEASGRAVERHVLVREGEHDRLLTIDLPKSEPASPPPPPPSEPAPSHGVPVGAWVLGGVGVAAMGVGTYFWIRGRGDRSDLYDTCGVTHSCDGSQVDAARAKILVGDITFGAGVVALGAAVGWALLASSSSSSASSTTAQTSAWRAPSIDVAPIRGGGVVAARAAF